MTSDVKTPELRTRFEALGRAADLLDGRVDPNVVTDARALVTKTKERAALTGPHTVVALAGSTGTGKSSLYNALSGLDLSTVGVLRPTTASAHACVWGREDASPLLDWLGVPERQRVTHDSELDLHPDDDLAGLVLLDLPDHDSTQDQHREEVDRLTARVDLLVWVTDPQKYADAATYDRYLRRLSDSEVVSVVVLNQVDRLSAEAGEQCLQDLRRLVTEAGLEKSLVLAASAVAGTGVGPLRSLLAEQVKGHRSATERLLTDLARSADRLAETAGLNGRIPSTPGAAATQADSAEASDTLVDDLLEAAGVPAVGEAVEDARRYDGWRATAWRPTRWWVRQATFSTGTGAGGVA
ncbi:MAG: GTPase, partial [Actinomycetes bacterium]